MCKGFVSDALAPRLMTDSNCSVISPALDTSMCSGRVTTARRPVQRTGQESPLRAPSMTTASGKSKQGNRPIRSLARLDPSHCLRRLGDHHDSVVARIVLLDLAQMARAAGEDTFTYGLMHQRQAGQAATIEQTLPRLAAGK
jgi:hypothetical protein